MSAFFQKINFAKDEIMAAVNSRTGRQTRLIFLGEIFNAAVGFMTNIFVIRKLSVSDYGLFVLFSSTMLLITGFGHLGWIETFVRFGSRHKDDNNFYALLKFFFFRIFASVFLVTAPVLLFSGTLIRHFYKRPDFAGYFHWAVVGAIVLSFNIFFNSFLRIRQNFEKYFFYQTSATALRFAGLLFLIFSSTLYLRNIVYIYILAPCVLVLTHVILFPGRSQVIYDRQHVSRELKKEITAYNYWLLLSIFTTNLIGNIDSQFLAYFYADNKQMANLGVASRMTLPINFAIISLTTIILPKLSASKDPRDIKIYFDKLKKFLFPFAIFILLGALAVVPLLKNIAGANYAGIENLLRLQIVSLFIVLLVNPLSVLMYSWGKTNLLAMMNAFQLLVDVVMNIILVPKYGAIGASMSVISVNLVALVCIYYWVYKGSLEHR